MKHPETSSREIARRILAIRYRSGLIGTYRRVGCSSWHIHLPDGDAILEDAQVIDAFGIEEVVREQEADLA